MNALNQSIHHGHNPAMKGCLFPKLSHQEILDCLRELGITITKDILAQPENNKETVTQLLESLAILLLGIQAEELSQPNFHGLQAIVYPQLHEESTFPK